MSLRNKYNKDGKILFKRTEDRLSLLAPLQENFVFVRHPFDKLVSAIQMGYLRKALTKKLQQRIVY